MGSIREEVMALPTEERLPYALKMLDDLLNGNIMQQSWLMENLGLTLTEAKLFWMLNANSPRIVSNEVIMNTMWPSGDIDGSMVKVMICKLRNKGLNIKTHWAVGYSVEEKVEIGEPETLHLVNRGRPWTEQHDEDLISMVKSKSTIGSIAYELDRSQRGVQIRITELKKAGRL